MRLDKPLRVGASGGHGPIRYDVETYEPGREVAFRFVRPKGFDGCHRFEVDTVDEEHVVLRHVIEMRTKGLARIVWPVAIRPLHDALIEDALDNAEKHAGGTPSPQRWSLWVRFLRYVIRRRRPG